MIKVKKSLCITVVLFIAIASMGCASFDRVAFFEPCSDEGRVPKSKYVHIGWYPSLTNRIAFSDLGVDVCCLNESYNVFYAGLILSAEPMIVLPLIPVLIGFITSPADYDPDDVAVELRFRKDIKSIRLQPESIKLSTSDGRQYNSVKIIHGPGYRNIGAVSDNVVLAVDEPVLIESESGVGNVVLFFDLRARKTKRFTLIVDDLSINNTDVNLPRVRFEKEHKNRYYITFD